MGVLFSKRDDVKSAISALADVASEEEKMAIAELVVGMDHLTGGLRNGVSDKADP